MTIKFATQKEQDAANDGQKLAKYLSRKKANCQPIDVIAVLDALAAAPSLSDLPPRPFRPHPLKAERKGQFAVWINKKERITFIPDHEDDENYRIDNYKTITKIKITELYVNYHKK